MYFITDAIHRSSTRGGRIHPGGLTPAGRAAMLRMRNNQENGGDAGALEGRLQNMDISGHGVQGSNGYVLYCGY